jgi:hypothetical protein
MTVAAKGLTARQSPRHTKRRFDSPSSQPHRFQATMRVLTEASMTGRVHLPHHGSVVVRCPSPGGNEQARLPRGHFDNLCSTVVLRENNCNNRRMKVFISWSGARSKAIANRLRTWLPDVIQGVKPWMSATDIDAGARWGQRVQGELQESRFGIICLTRTNQTAPWILFEAGALAKSIDDTFVCPYLIDLEPSELLAGPLVQFQAKRAKEQDTLDLVRTINRAQNDALPVEQLERTFAKWWPDLEGELASLPKDDGPASTPRPVNEMVEEILVAVRELRRSIPEDAFPISDAMRAALAAGATDDITGAARNIRNMFTQVPDAALMSPEFWDAFIRGFRSSFGKRTPADLLQALDQAAPPNKTDA